MLGEWIPFLLFDSLNLSLMYWLGIKILAVCRAARLKLLEAEVQVMAFGLMDAYDTKGFEWLDQHEFRH